MHIDPQVEACIKRYFGRMQPGEISYPLKLQNELPRTMNSFDLFSALDWVKDHAYELGITVDSEGYYIKN